MMDYTAIGSIILAGLVTPLVAQFASAIVMMLNPLFKRIGVFISRLLMSGTNVVTISNTSTMDKYGVWRTNDPLCRDSSDLIRAVLFVIGKRGAFAPRMQAYIDLSRESHGSPNDTSTKAMSRHTDMLPIDECKIEDYHISFTEYRGSPNERECGLTVELTIKSKRTTADIRNFINRCYKEYNMSRYSTNESDLYYVQRLSQGAPQFIKFRLNNTITFDNIIYPDKELIESCIERFEAGMMNKLCILLEGLPGCGKTSTIKAIAAKTGRNIIAVKMSMMLNDHQLMNLFYSEKMYCGDYSGICDVHIPMNKRIYVFEDIDAELDIVNSRDVRYKSTDGKENKEKPVNSGESLYDRIAKEMNSGVTLAGLLNVLDGVAELHGVIIVITTNYYEKLDSALVRPGRIDLHVNLKPMLKADARRLIQAKFPGSTCGDDIKDYQYTPAQIDGALKASTTEAQFIDLLKRY